MISDIQTFEKECLKEIMIKDIKGQFDRLHDVYKKSQAKDRLEIEQLRQRLNQHEKKISDMTT